MQEGQSEETALAKAFMWESLAYLKTKGRYLEQSGQGEAHVMWACVKTLAFTLKQKSSG